nr:zinc finger protein basonuclin-2-like [Meriones unguiculatus]
MAHFVPSPPSNCLSYKSEGRLGDQDWQTHFKVPCCGVDPSQLESEEAEVDVRERDTQRDREPKRARDLTLRDSCTDNSMQFGTRTTAAEPGFMGTWQNADTNLLFRMSQQVPLACAGRVLGADFCPNLEEPDQRLEVQVIKQPAAFIHGVAGMPPPQQPPLVRCSVRAKQKQAPGACASLQADFSPCGSGELN